MQIPEVVIELVENGESQYFKIKTDSIIIGRDPSCDIVLKEEGSSKKHCLIEYRQRRYWAIDLDSKNGTFINHEEISKVEFYLNDVIQIGEAYIKFAAEHMSVPTCQLLRRPGHKISLNRSISLVQSGPTKKDDLIKDDDHHGLKELTGIDFSNDNNKPKKRSLRIDRKKKKAK